MKLEPGQVCPCCKRPMRRLWKTTDYRYRRCATKPNAKTALALLAIAGPSGMTDDRMDARTKWGHQTTTPVMRALRYVGAIGWKIGPNGRYETETTRHGCPARVNVLAKHLTYGLVRP